MKACWMLLFLVSLALVRAQDVTFARDIRPLLEPACGSCHGPKKQKGGVRVDRREELSGFVIPGRPDQSRLVAIVSGEVRLKRNPSDHLLPGDDVARIREWIAAGAK